jgi:hypothetical protein
MAIERSFHTPGPLRLDLAVPAGEIDVETVDGEETTVFLDADDERALEGATVELRELGGGHELVVEVERRRGILGGMINISIGNVSLGNERFRLRVRAPHGPRLAVRSASADLDARGRYADADVKTASGEIELGAVDGDAAVKTASGDVSVAGVGGSLRVQSVSGDVRAERIGGTLTAQLVSGDLAVGEVGAGATTKSVSGDQELTIVAGEANLTSVSGDMRVGIRRGSRLYVDANSLSGDLDSEVELADAPHGDGGEGPLVELRAKTVSGDFRVVRA